MTMKYPKKSFCFISSVISLKVIIAVVDLDVD